ncbi:MAG: hypothetical protein ABEJ06_03625 [Haloarculaceae archaeon]
MRPRVTSALLWGVVGGLSFLVLLQGYRLVGGRPPLAPAATLAVALAVGILSAAGAALTERRLADR